MAKSTWLVFGASGLLGVALCPELARRGHQVTGVYHAHGPDWPGMAWKALDLMSSGDGAALVRATAPDVVVYAAGLTNVDACENDAARARRLHQEAAAECLGAAAEAGARPVLISTDHLWRGDRAMASEDTACDPQNAYARTKLAGEQAVLSAAPDALVLRTNFFGWGPPWRSSLSDWLLGEFSAGRPVNAFEDAFFTPIETGLLAAAIVALVETGATGIVHVAGRDRLSKYQFAVLLAEAFGHSPHLVKAASIEAHRFLAPRPRDMSLATDRMAALLGAPAPGIHTCIDALKSAKPAAKA